jgi:Gram-negative porin
MKMFGGLTKTSSRIAIAAALGLTLGGIAMKATPAKAADLGGDCCADLEERVAELEATTVRKGNKKVSVTLSGWVVKDVNWWWDGHDSSVAVGDKDYDLGSRFAVTGSATIAPGWSAGYNLTVNVGAEAFGILGNQNNEYASVNGTFFYGNTFADINTLYSYVYIKSDKWGALNWGHLSPASDNPAVLADTSGTVIESNFVGFEGGGFVLRPKGTKAFSTQSWNNFWLCNTLIAPGSDCFGTAEPGVRYDSPTWGGFRFETSYGTVNLLNSLGLALPTRDSHFWDIAAFYNKDWGDFKISLAYAYSWIESNPLTLGNESYNQVGGTIMHTPSGLGIYATGNWENVSGFNANGVTLPDTSFWGVKPFIKRTWTPLGATVLYGEYGQYNDFYGSIAGANLCGGANFIGPVCNANPVVGVTGSEMQRWGLGAVQEIDSAAMHVFLRWQHQELNADFVNGNGNKVSQGFDNFDFIQGGAIIFF